MMHLKIGMKELKPCPFCGSGAIFEEHIENGKTQFIVRCGRCGRALYQTDTVDFTYESDKSAWEELKQNAVDMWNERAYENDKE